MTSNKIKLPPGIDGKIEPEFRGEVPILPEEGGIFTPLRGWAYPVKGFPEEITVEVLAAIKGVIPVGLKFIEQSIKHFDLLALWSLKNTVEEMLIYCGKTLGGRQPRNPKRYCRPVREFYRVLTIQLDKFKKDQRDKHWKDYCFWKNVRSIICVACEFDNAYRYRLQDMLTELNQVNLRKHPIKELRRVLGAMVKREEREYLKNKWRRAKLILTLLLLIKPRIKRKIIEILSEINQEEIAFEMDDWYCIAMRKDYRFGGLTREEVISTKNFERS